MLASEIEPRNYALSLLASATTTEEDGSNSSSSSNKLGLLALVFFTVTTFIITYFFMKKDKRRLELDDCFLKQVDEEMPVIIPNSASASFSKSFDFLTVKTEKSKIFKQRSHSQNTE